MGFFGVLWGFRVLAVTLAGVFEVAPDGLVGVLVALSAGDDPRLSYFPPKVLAVQVTQQRKTMQSSTYSRRRGQKRIGSTCCVGFDRRRSKSSSWSANTLNGASSASRRQRAPSDDCPT